MDFWELDPVVRTWALDSLCVQGPEEATQPKMEAQCMHSAIKTYQNLSSCPTCLGFPHAPLLTFLACCWYSTLCCYLSHQHSGLPQSIGQFVLYGSFLLCADDEKSWTQIRNAQPQEEGRTL